jgi:hypothetical protein
MDRLTPLNFIGHIKWIECQGISTRFITGCSLANELLEARQGITLSRIISRYARYGLLLVDELGYVPFSKEGAELLLQVLAERHERGSVIITSNLGFADWTQVFGEVFKVEAEFTGWAARYEAERIRSPGQEIEPLDDERGRLIFIASSETVVISWLLSYREDAELLKPNWLVTEVTDNIETKAIFYKE